MVGVANGLKPKRRSIGFEAQKSKCGSRIELPELSGRTQPEGADLVLYPCQQFMYPSSSREGSVDEPILETLQLPKGTGECGQIRLLKESVFLQTRYRNPLHSLRRSRIRTIRFYDLIQGALTCSALSRQVRGEQANGV
jgi:hypothetical protein